MILKYVIEELIGRQVDSALHLKALRALVICFKAVNIVELGTRDGCTLSALVSGAAETGGHITTYDIVEKDVPWMTEEFENYVTFIHGHDLKVPLPEFPIDLLFLDTSHKREDTEKELLRWGPLVRKGGIIVLHDTMEGSKHHPGVYDPAKEWAECNGFPFLNDEQQNGLGIIFIL